MRDDGATIHFISSTETPLDKINYHTKTKEDSHGADTGSTSATQTPWPNIGISHPRC